MTHFLTRVFMKRRKKKYNDEEREEEEEEEKRKWEELMKILNLSVGLH